MPATAEIQEVPSRPIAIVRGNATANTLPPRIRALFDQFYADFKGKGGLNIVFYPTWDPVDEFEIECGVQVETAGNSSTPGGKVATVAHWGPYSELKAAHLGLHRYLRENGLKIAGPSWEVYGHWNDDPAKLRTDIFYLLAP